MPSVVLTISTRLLDNCLGKLAAEKTQLTTIPRQHFVTPEPWLLIDKPLRVGIMMVHEIGGTRIKFSTDSSEETCSFKVNITYFRQQQMQNPL